MDILVFIAAVAIVSYAIGYCCGIYYIQKAQKETDMAEL